MKKWMAYALALLALVTLAGCKPELPREWREALYGPDPTPTARLTISVPATLPTWPAAATPTPPPASTRLPTLTPVPTLTTTTTRTTTATSTATVTPASASLTLQQGTTWYTGGEFVPYNGVEDTFVSAWSKDANYADAQTLSVRQGNVMASLIYFHLGDLPVPMPLYRADMSIYVLSRSNDTPMTLTVSAVLKPWLLKEATWQRASQGLAWQIAGAGGETDREQEPLTEALVNERGVWVTFNVTNFVLEWLKQPQNNQGVIIRGEAASAVQYDIVSSDSRDARHRPYLTLTFPTGAIALGPLPAPTATRMATPTVDAVQPEANSILRLLPQGKTVVARADADLDSDGALEIVAVYRGPVGGANVAVFKFYPGSGGAGDYRLIWSSQELAAGAPVSLELVDITADGQLQILVSAANPTAAGRMLYVFVPRLSGYRLATPVGGFFAGKDGFGETGYELADVNGDGRVEILARHGTQVEVYAWDGVNFAWRSP